MYYLNMTRQEESEVATDIFKRSNLINAPAIDFVDDENVVDL